MQTATEKRTDAEIDSNTKVTKEAVMFPAGIWCQNDVVTTSMRRHHVASTLIRRHFGTKCPLGYVMLCYVMLCYVMLCYVMLCYVMLCYVMSCRVVSCRVVSCRVVSCRVVSCRVVSCHVMSCHVMSCYVFFFFKKLP